jgi:hypothetical protein
MWLLPAYVFVATCFWFYVASEPDDAPMSDMEIVMCAAAWPIVIGALGFRKLVGWLAR